MFNTATRTTYGLYLAVNLPATPSSLGHELGEFSCLFVITITVITVTSAWVTVMTAGLW